MFGFIKKSKENKSDATKARKGKGYYLEIDEKQVAEALNGNQAAKADSEAKPKPAEAATPATTEAPTAEAVKAEAAAPETTEASTAEAVKAEAAAPAKTAKTAKRAKKAKIEAPTAEPVLAAAPVVAAPVKQETPVATTFAPNYLLTLSSTDGRRRPGANMTSFLAMARQVKTPKA